jgi:hypothetical protein
MSDKSTEIAALAAEVAGPRTSVANVFAAVAGANGDTMQLEGIAFGAPDDRQAYAAALTHAYRSGWLLPLIHGLLDARATKGKFVECAKELFGEDELFIQTLQATLDINDPTASPSVLAWVLLESARQVCRIDIDGAAMGTGFLISPILVVTGYHVVVPLLENGKPKAGSAAKLTIVFDDQIVMANGVRKRLTPVTVNAAEQWLVTSSKCLDQELIGTAYADVAYLQNIDKSSGPWDFALIQLERTIDPERRGLSFNDLDIKADQPVMILQHPLGKQLNWAMARVADTPPPGARFFHSGSTKPGSSGGPCLNMEGRVVGIHQAGQSAVPPPGQKRPPNRAVPILPFAQQLVTTSRSVAYDPPFLTNLTEDQNYHPVLGREATQQWIWRAAAPQSAAGGIAKPILRVASSVPKRGAQFTEKILRSLLPADRHLVVKLEAGNLVAHTPDQFAADLVMKATGAEATDFPANGSDTADDNRIRTELIPAAMEAIGRARGDRLIWFVMRFPPKLELPDKTKIREALDAFYAQTSSYSWMRLVLLGLNTNLPPPLDQATESQRLEPLRGANLFEYLVRKWSSHDKAQLAVLIDELVDGLDPDAEAHQEIMAATARRLDARFKKRIGGGGP